MNAAQLYVALWALGLVAFWQTGGFRKLFCHPWPRLWDWPDPDDAPVLLLFLMTPFPGLFALVEFGLAVWARMAWRT